MRSSPVSGCSSSLQSGIWAELERVGENQAERVTGGGGTENRSRGFAGESEE